MVSKLQLSDDYYINKLEEDLKVKKQQRKTSEDSHNFMGEPIIPKSSRDCRSE